MSGLQRGDVVTVRDFRGEPLERWVWAQSGAGVLLCSEVEFKRATRLNIEPLYVGFPLSALIDTPAPKEQEQP